MNDDHKKEEKKGNSVHCPWSHWLNFDPDLDAQKHKSLFRLSYKIRQVTSAAMTILGNNKKKKEWKKKNGNSWERKRIFLEGGVEGGCEKGKGLRERGRRGGEARKRGGSEEREEEVMTIHFTSEEGQRRRHLHRHGQQDHTAGLSVCSWLAKGCFAAVYYLFVTVICKNPL